MRTLEDILDFQFVRLHEGSTVATRYELKHFIKF
jgi:hypothetical protein